DEGVFIGYRWYSSKGVPVCYPFGHGLSYTTFDITNAKVTRSGKGFKVMATLKNTGAVAGAEVVQLYVSDVEASVERPVKELKGFEKVYLEPGQSRKVEFTLDRQALSFFDAEKHAWVAEPGEFHALLGTSSEDIKADLTFTL
ncbi:MAG: fibronectin type III-like domain-contianing protein, partial [Bacteroidales bacterium]|nr:fibronectin type III-like domain-contianing protein [Bacteroidales bacterium]